MQYFDIINTETGHKSVTSGGDTEMLRCNEAIGSADVVRWEQ